MSAPACALDEGPICFANFKLRSSTESREEYLARCWKLVSDNLGLFRCAVRSSGLARRPHEVDELLCDALLFFVTQLLADRFNPDRSSLSNWAWNVSRWGVGRAARSRCPRSGWRKPKAASESPIYASGYLEEVADAPTASAGEEASEATRFLAQVVPAVEEAIDAVPIKPQRKEMLRLRLLARLPLRAISEKLGVTKQRVSQVLADAIQSLARSTRTTPAGRRLAELHSIAVEERNRRSYCGRPKPKDRRPGHTQTLAQARHPHGVVCVY